MTPDPRVEEIRGHIWDGKFDEANIRYRCDYLLQRLDEAEKIAHQRTATPTEYELFEARRKEKDRIANLIIDAFPELGVLSTLSIEPYIEALKTALAKAQEEINRYTSNALVITSQRERDLIGTVGSLNAALSKERARVEPLKEIVKFIVEHCDRDYTREIDRPEFNSMMESLWIRANRALNSLEER